MVALYPLSSPNHNVLCLGKFKHAVALYPLSSPNHNDRSYAKFRELLRYILFHHQTTTLDVCFTLWNSLRYILFHHQTTTFGNGCHRLSSCVISSFITKPQLAKRRWVADTSCVISSFITKPQPQRQRILFAQVALYPLSSPNHNPKQMQIKRKLVALYPLSSPNHNLRCILIQRTYVALYPLSSPNHNLLLRRLMYLTLRYILFHHQTTTPIPSLMHWVMLRYILFHHQTTTYSSSYAWVQVLRYILFHHQTTTRFVIWVIPIRCVISSFITKPQLSSVGSILPNVALYPLSSPNHNINSASPKFLAVALYPLSSPNHNFTCGMKILLVLRYILFHHQTTTFQRFQKCGMSCVISSFITKPQHYRVVIN